MSSFNVLRPRKDIRSSSTSNPAVSDGSIIGELFQNETTGEIFTLMDRVILSWGTYSRWRGTLGTHVDPDILSPTNSNLVAMYTMDNISGSTLLDETTNNNDGTISGATSSTGQINNSLSFDGIDDSVDCGFTGSALTSGAVSIWATRSVSGQIELVSRADTLNSDNYISLRIEGTTGEVVIASIPSGGSANTVKGDTTISVSGTVFNHMVFQSTGTAWDVWVNGIQQSLTVSAGSNTGDWFGDNGVDNIKLAVLDRATNTFGNTREDHIRFFDRTLTQPEITALYNEGAQ